MRFDITIAGEINLDILLYGLPEELPRERELLATRCVVTLGSSSAITAHNLAVLGSRVGFITRAGRDSFGEIALQRLREANVDLERVTHSDSGTGTGLTMLLPHARSRHIITYPGCMDEMQFEHLDLGYLASARHFHLSSYFLHRGWIDRIPELFAHLKKAGLSISLDTNDDPTGRWQGGLQEALKYLDILMPNEREACKIAGQADFERAVRKLSDIVPMLVVKMGSQGAMAIHNGTTVNAAPPQVEVVDPVGAGDSFNAGFLHQYLKGAGLQDCLNYGNVTAAFSTTRPGGTEAFRDVNRWNDFRSQQQRA